jgi:hypothetical protein
MPFVRRDESGAVIAIFEQDCSEATEELAADHPEVGAFFERLEDSRSRLARSDTGMSRVLEDVIDILIDKGVILITDLPMAAVEKIAERRSLRGKGFGFEDLFESDQDKVV